MTTPARKPSKPWRVYGRGPVSTECRSQRSAYDVVAYITKAGDRARVYQWADGSWQLYEVIEAQEAVR